MKAKQHERGYLAANSTRHSQVSRKHDYKKRNKNIISVNIRFGRKEKR